VKSSYAATYRPDLTSIVIVGDVTPERARSVVEAAFGGWKAVGPTPNVFPPAVPPNKPSQVMIPATGRVQAEVTMGETIPISYHDPDYPVLTLGNTVLTGGFYASLLFHDLRETHGYAYTVGSSVNGGRNRTAFSVTFGADPQNVGRASRLVVDDLSMLQKTPLATDRLTRAKALIVGELPVRKESYEGLALQLGAYAVTGRPLDQDTRDAQAQLGATADQVRAAFAKWIRPNDFARVILVPASK
jgi:zinc protease